MPVCTKCQIEKLDSEFSLLYPQKNKIKKRPDCKACVRARAKIAYDADPGKFLARTKIISQRARSRNRKYVDDYLRTHPCMDCGENEIDLLDFDHVRGEKITEVSILVGNAARLWKLEQEIAKCDVRCANCHRRITARRRREAGKALEPLEYPEYHDSGWRKLPRLNARKVTWPTYEELIRMLRTRSKRGIARDMGINEASVRNWCKVYELV